MMFGFGILTGLLVLPLVGAAFMGARRFGEFEERMGAPPTIVAERLRTFCEIGVLRATPNPERSDGSVYGLTEKGRAFFPMTSFVLTWGERWFRAPEGPAVIMTHRCGAKFDPRLACSGPHQQEHLFSSRRRHTG